MQPRPQPPVRILELLWWSFLAGAIFVPLAVALAIQPNPQGAPPGAAGVFWAGFLASFATFLLRRRFAERLQSPAFQALPEQDRLKRTQTAMFIGLAVAELPMYAGVVHYILTGRAIGLAFLTLISLALMCLFHPSRIARTR